MVRLADYVVSFLEHVGVRDIFTISGGGSIFLNDALGQSNMVRFSILKPIYLNIFNVLCMVWKHLILSTSLCLFEYQIIRENHRSNTKKRGRTWEIT